MRKTVSFTRKKMVLLLSLHVKDTMKINVSIILAKKLAS